MGDTNNEELRLLSDFSVDCKSTEYKKWIFLGAAPIIAIVGIFFPFIILIKLKIYKNSKSLKEPEILYKYGFFYLAY